MSNERLISRASLWQFIIFLTGGILSAGIDVGLIWIFLENGFGSFFSVSVGFFVGLIFNYLYNAKLTFKKAVSGESIFRYGLVVTINYGLTLLIVYVALHALGLTTILGKIGSLPVIAINSYLMSRYWIFRN